MKVYQLLEQINIGCPTTETDVTFMFNGQKLTIRNIFSDTKGNVKNDGLDHTIRIELKEE